MCQDLGNHSSYYNLICWINEEYVQNEWPECFIRLKNYHAAEVNLMKMKHKTSYLFPLLTEEVTYGMSPMLEISNMAKKYHFKKRLIRGLGLHISHG